MLEMDDTVMHVLEENPITLTYLKFIRAHYPKSHIQTLAAFTIVKYYRLFSEKPLSITSSKNRLANMVAKYIAKNFNIRAKKTIYIFSKEEQTEYLYFYFPNKKTIRLTII
jgi:hypothetical protein